MKQEEMLGEIISRIEALRETQPRVLIGMDGRCSAGKTTLAEALRQETGCPVIHMDDFYLFPEQRTQARMDEPGGNVAYERFLENVLDPLRRGKPACYQPYDCSTKSMLPQITVGVAPIMVIEGSYSLHPAFRDCYDIRIFLDLDPDEQLRRLAGRNTPASIQRFQDKWIPLEEAYISHYAPDKCEDILYFKT